MNFFYYLLYLLIFFLFIKCFIFELSNEFFSNTVEIKDLKEGMIPSELVYMDREGYKKMRLDARGFYFMVKEGIKPITSIKRLSRQDIENLKKLHRERKISSDFIVQEIIPFALFMFLGILLTIIFQGNFVVALITLLRI